MSVDRCVCCGDIIPEGRQVCPMCESKVAEAKCVVCGKIFYKHFPYMNSVTCSEECRNIRRRQWEKARVRRRKKVNKSQPADFGAVDRYIAEYRAKTGELLSYGKAFAKMEMEKEKR